MSASLIITALYASLTVVSFFSYAPQFLLLVRNKDVDPAGMSVTSWSIWTSSQIIILLYASVVMQDVPFMVVAAVDVIWHILILFFLLKRKYKRNALVDELV